LDTLSGRVAWAITKIKEDPDWTDVRLGEKLGVDKNTIAAYRKKEGLIKGSVIEGLAVSFGYNPIWLLKGEGDPLEENIKGAGVNESRVEYKAGPVIKISEDLTLAAKVLESNTAYATALHLNIRSFSAAVSAESLLVQYQRRFDDIEAKIKESENLSGIWFSERIEGLEKKITALQEENRILKGRLNHLGAPGPGEDPGAGSGPDSEKKVI